MVPTAGNAISFEISGPGKIIGVGNGDPSSHEPDQFIEHVAALPLADWHMKGTGSPTKPAEVAYELDDSGWDKAFGHRWDRDRPGDTNNRPSITVYRATFSPPQSAGDATFALALRSLGESQSVYLNGQLIAENVSRANAAREILLPADILRPGRNVVAVVATSSERGRDNRGDRGGTPGNPGLVRMTTPAPPWQRHLFSGLAQIVVQSTGQPGEITLTARSPGVADGMLKIQAQPAAGRAALP
jgi:beta-galactosidase